MSGNCITITQEQLKAKITGRVGGGGSDDWQIVNCDLTIFTWYIQPDDVVLKKHREKLKQFCLFFICILMVVIACCRFR